MAFRVILIENEVTIKVKLNNLIITKCGEDIWIPLDDISMIVLDNLASNLSTRLMCQLAEQGIGLMLCNQQHLPTGFYSALYLFLKENYPYEKEFSNEHVQKIICNIIQSIGQSNFLNTVEENVVCKLINQTLLLDDKIPDEKIPEIAFLKA